MAEFRPTIALSGLDGAAGFRIAGASTFDNLGVSVSSAGDVNGDGFDDVVVGARTADPGGRFTAGSSYVVFGKAGGFGASLDLAALGAANGFRIDGASAGDASGSSVSSAGDVNGDGVDDIIIGAVAADPGGRTSAGSSYVVFGRQGGGFGASLDLADLDAADGFRLDGAAAQDRTGRSVSSAGDVNGDGVDDVIVGAPSANPSGRGGAGSSYVVFGRDGGGFDAAIDLSSLDPANGFRIDGALPGHSSGYSVFSAGDVNGDGFDDLIVGAPFVYPGGRTIAGASYVVFGKAGGFGASFDLSGIDGANGFRIDGASAYDRSGHSVSSAGDVNGDGVDDVIVGAPDAARGGGAVAGASYVVFGREGGGFAATINLDSLDGVNGFRIDGVGEGDNAGVSVSSAGDVNGDGFDDVIIGAIGADPGGRSDVGASYVVFGKARGFDASIALAILNGTDGFRLEGVATDDGNGVSVSSAGDVNGDGFDDVIVGANTADPGGRTSGGASYVVFGRAPDAAVTRTGTDVANTINGGAFGDTLIGLGGDDALRGNAGDDTLVGGNGADLLRGDDGLDTAVYAGSTAGVVVDLTRAGAQSGGDAAGDTLTGVENIFGSVFSDALTGDAGENFVNDGGVGGTDTLTGGAGDDTYAIYNSGAVIDEIAGGGVDRVAAGVSYALADGVRVEQLNVTSLRSTYDLDLTGNGFNQLVRGNDGANVIDGRGGHDLLFGEGGADVFRFSTALGAGNTDRIGDFSVADDQIELDSAIFGGLSLGALDASAFKENATTPRDADDRIIYNASTGSLFFDPDGSGTDFAAVKFAALTPGLGLTAADFTVN